ncbi:MAG: purine-binding chemotaxis protein CheW [Ruminococcaceae bacterium]|jgi:purine-binding chemotaxis protein CheW|nr:purine-binding chemotaxis protein CheW [Oscillospiraceae bacterium]
MENDSFETVNIAVQADNDEMKGKYLTFWTDSQLFGVPIKDVVQIVGMQEITEIPEYPYYAKGIINLRGAIVPLIDVRLRLGKPEQEYNDRTCIIVCNVHDIYFGFIVDEVEEVTDIADDQISPPPKLNSDTVNQYLTGVAHMGEKLVLTINTAKILGEDEFEALVQTAQ